MLGPREKELGLDQVALEESMDPVAQHGDVALAARAHHDALRVTGAQLRFAFCLCGAVTDMVDLVEDPNPRYLCRADFTEHGVGHFDLPFPSCIAGVDDVEQQ